MTLICSNIYKLLLLTAYRLPLTAWLLPLANPFPLATLSHELHHLDSCRQYCRLHLLAGVCGVQQS